MIEGKVSFARCTIFPRYVTYVFYERKLLFDQIYFYNYRYIFFINLEDDIGKVIEIIFKFFFLMEIINFPG